MEPLVLTITVIITHAKGEGFNIDYTSSIDGGGGMDPRAHKADCRRLADLAARISEEIDHFGDEHE